MNRTDTFVIIGILISIIIAFFCSKTKIFKEEFSETSNKLDERNVEKIIKKVFSNLNQRFEHDKIVPDITQGSTLSTKTQNKGDSDRIGVVHWLNISSGKRDIEKFPDSNCFVNNVPSKLYNVYSIELIKASVPRSQYTIDKHNQWMDIIKNDTDPVSIEIPVGTYSIGSYLSALTTAFVSNVINIQLDYDGLTSTVSMENISSVTSYSILYSPNSGSHYEESNFNELGFLPEDFTIAPGEVKRGRRVDLFGTCCVDIELKNVNYENGDHIVGSIQMSPQAITTYENPYLFSKRHLKPLIEISNLRVEITFKASFKKRRLYILNGFDINFSLEIICLEYSPPFLPILQSFR
jgi:hypothetical protein